MKFVDMQNSAVLETSICQCGPGITWLLDTVGSTRHSAQGPEMDLRTTCAAGFLQRQARTGAQRRRVARKPYSLARPSFDGARAHLEFCIAASHSWQCAHEARSLDFFRHKQSERFLMSTVASANTAPTFTAGQVLVDALRLHGVDRVFCVPGESYLAVLDALHDARDAIELVVAKHEGGASNMAEADGKMTGRPGVCMVTRGPGATHASNGVHTAQQDSTPMVLFIGQIARGEAGRDVFQEVDYEASAAMRTVSPK